MNATHPMRVREWCSCVNRAIAPFGSYPAKNTATITAVSIQAVAADASSIKNCSTG